MSTQIRPHSTPLHLHVLRGSPRTLSIDAALEAVRTADSSAHGGLPSLTRNHVLSVLESLEWAARVGEEVLDLGGEGDDEMPTTSAPSAETAAKTEKKSKDKKDAGGGGRDKAKEPKEPKTKTKTKDSHSNTSNPRKRRHTDDKHQIQQIN
ncbi:hypothetical protein HDU82_008036 [Entophlyctis luteolus]|nr:hypothetical protein HDU82_008036 [Entophlyctis luteolus]